MRPACFAVTAETPGAHTVRRVDRQHALSSLSILTEAAEWSTRFGAALWRPADFTLEGQQSIADSGELVGGFHDGRMVACMRLQTVDRLFWPDDPPGDALYVHKVAVLRTAAGQGWTARLLDFALSEAKAARAGHLRLDTAPNTALVRLYKGFGFTLVDSEPRLFGDRMLVRLERSADL